MFSLLYNHYNTVYILEKTLLGIGKGHFDESISLEPCHFLKGAPQFHSFQPVTAQHPPKICVTPNSTGLSHPFPVDILAICKVIRQLLYDIPHFQSHPYPFIKFTSHSIPLIV